MELSQEQKDVLKDHAMRYGMNHSAMMLQLMKKGLSIEEAHQLASESNQYA